MKIKKSELVLWRDSMTIFAKTYFDELAPLGYFDQKQIKDFFREISVLKVREGQTFNP